MKTSRFFTFAVTCLALSAAQAQTADPATNPRMYAEIGYTSAKYKESYEGFSVKGSPNAVSGTFGFQVHPNLSVEAYLGMGTGKDSVKFDGMSTPLDVKLGNMVGVFARPSVAIGDKVELFGRAGWVSSELKFSAFGDSTSQRESSMAYGVGANFNLSKTSYLQASWTSFYKKHDIKIEGLTLAYGLRF